MKRRLPILSFAIILACSLLGGIGCTSLDHTYETRDAHPGLQSTQQNSLTSLPAPAEKVVAAVYQFRDQTGQYEAKEAGSSFSRAVTQGATSILVKALKDSEWFRPIERKGLSNLTQERDIIRSIRAQYDRENAQQLPPLLYAGVLLEGGIIGYDTNVITGGGGLRIGGIGGSATFRRDQVTVYLRAVSTQTGEVLKTVHTTKTIVSQELEGGAFRYVASDLLLETEAGMSYNEPTTMAVTEAIDASVRDLVVAGVQDGVFTPEDSTQASAAIEAYEERKEQAARRDYFDRLLQPNNRPGLGLEVGGGGLRYQGDYKRPRANPSASLALRGMIGSHWAVGVQGSVSRLEARGTFEKMVLFTGLQTTYYFVPRAQFTPFLRLEGGVQGQLEKPYRLGETAFLMGGGSVGMEYMAGSRFGISASFGTRYSLSDNLDGARVGTYHDSVWQGSIGLSFYGITSMF